MEFVDLLELSVSGSSDPQDLPSYGTSNENIDLCYRENYSMLLKWAKFICV